MKKKFARTALIVSCILVVILGAIYVMTKKDNVYEEDGVKYISKIEGTSFFVYYDGKWEKKFLKGVNIGAAKPGYFPGELAITKEEYLRWFQHISEMNAEVIRVYTTLKPAFYDALLEYNQKAEKPLYLIQGVWVKEETMAELNDAYANGEQIKNDFIKDATDLVDVLHGNATLPVKNGFASGEYKSDVSQYVIGWLMGIEWDPYFVQGTNDNNPERTSYTGSYLYTEGASPFEAVLCEVGDKTLVYEASNYQMTRAISFNNWLTTDMLDHPNEPNAKEDMAEFNMEHIKAQPVYKSGLFASYHIYPYYPDFLNHQKEYITFKDEDGEIDAYRAYLKDLIKEHTMPVLVAEFGVPASRGKAHDSLYSGFDQGDHSETEQGEILTKLLEDIYSEGYCGAIVFVWQDEWFKKTWNTMDLDLSDSRPYWSNPQTNEQEFGLLAFDPGEESVCDVDGDISEWDGDEPVSSTDNATVYVKSDEKYVYLMVKTTDFDFSKDSLYIPVDTIPGQGNTVDKAANISFECAADFVIRINGEKNSRITVDSYYDSFYYLYAEQFNMIAKNSGYVKKSNGIFNSMYLCLSRAVYLPVDKTTIPFSQYETGLLTYGDANPIHENYNSLADFCYKDGNIEIRIPWQLLNVMDPSTKQIMSDLYKNKGIVAEKTEGMYFGVGIVKNEATSSLQIGMKYYTWDAWTLPTYHERLKPSYYILLKAFADIN